MWEPHTDTMTWIVYAIAAIIVVAISDVFRKLASGFSDPFFANLIFQMGSITAAVLAWSVFSRKSLLDPKLMTFAFLGGLFISTFTLISFKTLAIGPGASTVLPFLRIGGIVLLVIMGILFLKESFTAVKAIGLVFSFIGLFLLYK